MIIKSLLKLILFTLVLSTVNTSNLFGLSIIYTHRSSQDTIITSIISQDLISLKRYVEKYGPNQQIDSGRATLLSFAIQQNVFSVIKYLLKSGADANQIVNDYSPLMICATYNYHHTAKLLIKHSAKVDLANNFKNTPLIIASRYGNLEMVKLLLRKGANPFLKNQTRQNALDYATNFKKIEIVDFLRKRMKKYANANLPDLVDGPYIFNVSETDVDIKYLIHKQKKKSTKFTQHVISWKDSIVEFSNPQYDDLVKIKKRPDNKLEKHYFYNIPKIFVVGDVHGEFISLVKLLKTNGIIGNHLNWTFGKGHLVFIGDIFDRGEDVTETLWLIYRLEEEAKNAGGNVHFILGNHEMMVLQNDLRYINSKYEYLTAAAGINYSELYSNQTIIGKWLRTKKAIIVIDSLLFTHGGLSYDLVLKELKIDKINQVVENQINSKDLPENISLDLNNLVIEEKGPLWFRGYFGENSIIPKTTDEEIEKILKFYQVNKVIIGHTEVSKIAPIYNGKVIPVDVPFNREGIESQGLLIVNSKFYKCFDDGHCEPLE